MGVHKHIYSLKSHFVYGKCLPVRFVRNNSFSINMNEYGYCKIIIFCPISWSSKHHLLDIGKSFSRAVSLLLAPTETRNEGRLQTRVLELFRIHKLVRTGKITKLISVRLYGVQDLSWDEKILAKRSNCCNGVLYINSLQTSWRGHKIVWLTLFVGQR